MRTTRFSLNVSLDGYCDHTMFNPDEAVLDYFTDMMGDVDTAFYGRIMYQLMFPYWSDVARNQSGSPAENRFAERLSAISSVVVSKSLEQLDSNVQIVRSDPAGALLKLKQQKGKTILVDSISLLPELASAGLIDEFNLVIHPVFVGRGRHLFNPASLLENINLKLADSKVFKCGAVALHYKNS